MRDHPLEDCPEIAQHKDLMYMAEGYDYARNSHFVPNAKAILENNDITNEERQLHRTIMAMADRGGEPPLVRHCLMHFVQAANDVFQFNLI